MRYVHFDVAYYGVLAVPSIYAYAVECQLLQHDFDGWYLNRTDGLMVAQLPGAFWIKQNAHNHHYAMLARL